MTAEVNLTRNLRSAIAQGLALFFSLAIVAGCQPSSGPTPSAGRSGASSEGRTDRGDVLFTAVVKQLRDLASYVDTELQPPMVILDSKASSDGQDVLATCGVYPGAAEGPINFISVPKRNGRFRSLGVRPGDVLKYYILYDEESLETGISQTIAMDMTVAQVIDDNSLLVEGGLNRIVPEPAKIEIWRYGDERLKDIARQIATYVRFRLPVFDWEPSPDGRVLKQIVERLNQWMRLNRPKSEWSVDPLLATLDPTLAGDERLKPLISEAALSDSVIQPHEGRLLQEAVWLRNISRWAQGESFDDVARATALFDWTIRNIQLDGPADDGVMPYRPWEILVFGHGTAEQRAWVFASLCRQQGLDVIVFEVPENGATKFWLPALVKDGQLYLFDTRLGLPIPGAGGQGLATLAVVQADPSLLRQLDLADAPYPVTAAQLDGVTANVVADPFDLSRRAATIEAKLSGDDRLALAGSPSEIAGKLKDVPGIRGTKIWDMPFRTLRDQLRIPIAARRELAVEFEPFAWRPTLWKARVLHFQGRSQGDVDPQSTATHPDEVVDDQAEAIGLYTSPQVRPPDRVLDALTSEPKKKIYSAAKVARAIGSDCCCSTRANTRRPRTGSAIRGSPRRSAARGPTAHATTWPAPTRPRARSPRPSRFTKATRRRNATAIGSAHAGSRTSRERSSRPATTRITNLHAGPSSRALVPVGLGGRVGRRHGLAGSDAAGRAMDSPAGGRGPCHVLDGAADGTARNLGRGAAAGAGLVGRDRERRCGAAAGLARQLPAAA